MPSVCPPHDLRLASLDTRYGHLKTGEPARGNLIVQWDAPFVNAGVFYAQNVKRGDATHWVLAELHRRIALFMYHPEAVQDVVPWARPPYFANSDEQASAHPHTLTLTLASSPHPHPRAQPSPSPACLPNSPPRTSRR